MIPDDVLVDLIERLGAARGGDVTVGGSEMASWPQEAVRALKAQGLLSRARSAFSAVCSGCEEECVLPVHASSPMDKTQAPFILCEKRSDTNRVVVDPRSLVQWRFRIEAIRDFIAQTLALRGTQHESEGWPIGMYKGLKRSQMLALSIAGNTLILTAGDHSIPLADLIEYRDGLYALDAETITRLVDSSTTGDSRYTPTEAKREARKQKTKERNERLQRAYRKFRKEHPDKNDKWIARAIIKLPEWKESGLSTETVRRNMKK